MIYKQSVKEDRLDEKHKIIIQLELFSLSFWNYAYGARNVTLLLHLTRECQIVLHFWWIMKAVNFFLFFYFVLKFIQKDVMISNKNCW